MAYNYFKSMFVYIYNILTHFFNLHKSRVKIHYFFNFIMNFWGYQISSNFSYINTPIIYGFFVFGLHFTFMDVVSLHALFTSFFNNNKCEWKNAHLLSYFVLYSVNISKNDENIGNNKCGSYCYCIVDCHTINWTVFFTPNFFFHIFFFNILLKFFFTKKIVEKWIKNSIYIPIRKQGSKLIFFCIKTIKKLTF